ncbi:MAG: glutathione S-transferase family protein [Betaproteobacteria bacterium]|nr:MAG: glutathione S-transferase family protein [Betaproteobacteria bacterium]
MTDIKLIGVAASRTFRNIWMLEELGLTYSHDPIHYTDPALKTPPYVAINPNAKLPMAVVDGMPIFESLAINLYFAEKFGGALSPTDAEERGLVAQWTLWAATSVEDDLGKWAYHTMFLPEAERDPKLAADCLARVQTPLAVLDGVLAKQAFLVGNRFTVADLNVACVCYRLLAMELADKPNLKRWLHAAWARPAALTARRARGDKV